MFSFPRFFRPRPSLPDASWLIVGLGNPGPKYESTRHNVGFLAVDDYDADWSHRPEYRAETATLGDVLLVRPMTFMNLSGEAVGALARALEIPADHVVVIHDELDLPAGTVRLKAGGNENGHNGLKSITEHLGTRDYLRVRIGIGRPPAGIAVPDYVLGGVDKPMSAEAAEAARLITEVGLQKAQNEIHLRQR